MKFKQHLIYKLIPTFTVSLGFSLLFFPNSLMVILFPFLLVGIRYLQWLNYQVNLDSQKLVLAHGIFSRHHEQIRIDKIQKIKMVHHITHWPFSQVGNIQIETGNELVIHLENIENYKQLYLELEKLTNKNI